MRKPGEGTKGVEDKEGETNRFWNSRRLSFGAQGILERLSEGKASINTKIDSFSCFLVPQRGMTVRTALSGH
jgi:hypothetical protein